MPIYEFRCENCKKEFECLVIGTADDVSCPSCKGKKVERILSAASFKSGGKVVSSSSSGCASCSGGSCSSCH